MLRPWRTAIAATAGTLSSGVLRTCERGQEFVIDNPVAQCADMLPAHDAVAVDEECFGRAVDTPIQCVAAVGIDQHDPIRVAELLEPAQGVGVLVLPVVADDAHALGLGKARDHRMFFAARRTPAAPYVQDEWRAVEVGE